MAFWVKKTTNFCRIFENMISLSFQCNSISNLAAVSSSAEMLNMFFLFPKVFQESSPKLSPYIHLFNSLIFRKVLELPNSRHFQLPKFPRTSQSHSPLVWMSRKQSQLDRPSTSRVLARNDDGDSDGSSWGQSPVYSKRKAQVFIGLGIKLKVSEGGYKFKDTQKENVHRNISKELLGEIHFEIWNQSFF